MSTDVVCVTPPTDVEQGGLKAELRNLRRRGARNAAGEEYSQGRSCARCKTPLGRIYNTGASCPRCRHRVCRQCREYRGSNGTDWLCLVCHKITEIKAVSGEWMNEASETKRAGRRKFLASPADILKRSIRRSWTINGPPASWCAIRGSPEFRAYQSLPRHQDYFEVTRSDLVIPLKTGDTEEARSVFVERGRRGSDAETLLLVKFLEAERRGAAPHVEEPPTSSPGHQNPGRISQIKPPRIHAKPIVIPDVKQTPTKSVERKSNIPILRRSSREFEDIRSPLESTKRSLIPQRYRGSTDDLRRSREDITAPSQIPKLFSPRVKESQERLKRQDSKDEIRYLPKLQSSRKEERAKDFREDMRQGPPTPKSVNPLKNYDERSPGQGGSREETRSGIKVFSRREGKEISDPGTKEGSRTPSKTCDKEEKNECGGEDEIVGGTPDDEENSGHDESGTVTKGDENEIGRDACSSLVIGEEIPTDQTMVEERGAPSREPEGDERKFRDGPESGEDVENEGLNSSAVIPEQELEITSPMDDGGKDTDVREETVRQPEEKNDTTDFVESNSPRKAFDDFQVVRRKFSKEEFSNPDDTDDVPNRRSSSHLSPEASPLSTRSSRYSPRESESEPTPALPRKTGESSASQRVRDAISRTRRESNSSTRYESSGSESIRLSSHVETRRVRFGGGSGIEEVQRDSATSAGEDEPRNSIHNTGSQRDSRTVTGALQGRAVRRRRQFDTQGSRRRGRSHARGCAEELQHFQVVGRGGGHISPSQGQSGQDQPIIDYRRLVFISSDSSSGREEDDADSSSGSSSLNGNPRSSLTQGLEDCDWDYFESGGSIPPLAHLQVGLVGTLATQTHRLHPGISALSSQDWSCCPGRGSSACQACGGARGANVFPVPVPIPVPVPYPVPVPASLWTSGLTNSSMINCTSAELGALQLSRGGGPSPLHPAATQWYPWPPRFVHDVNAVPRPSDQPGLLDPRTREAFVFHPSVTFEQLKVNPETKAKEEPAQPPPETKQADEQPAQNPPRAPEDAGGTTDEPGEASSSTDSDEEELNPKSRPNSQAKMYRLSQGNSGSSSGRSSADSSDLEDSASHHFSRVFVVNDDSSTSDNDPDDPEDAEDSDSNREVGITLRRVTALPEDGPVVLRHVRFLDEDRRVPGGQPDRVDAIDGRRKAGLRYLRNFDPEANEIYLVDSKEDDSEHQIELKSVRSLDPDHVDTFEYKKIEDENEDEDDNEDEDEDEAETTEPDSLMPDHPLNCPNIVPDSLEINELSTKSDENEDEDENEEEALEEREEETAAVSGVESQDEIQPDPPATNTADNQPGLLVVTRGDKPPALSSGVNGDTAVNSVDDFTQCESSSSSSVGMAVANTADDSSSTLNLTGGSEPSTTGSSETNTGSEVSSDELHEYEINPWARDRNEEDDEAAAFSALNDDLVLARTLFSGNSYAKKLLQFPDHDTRNSGFTSDGFSTDDGGSSRLDSGVATGLDDTNASGRTDDASIASFETTPGGSIELVHGPGGEDDGRRGGGVRPEERENGNEEHTVNDLISVKIHEIFKSVEDDLHAGAQNHRGKKRATEESGARGERHDAKQVEGGQRELERGGIATAQVSPVERRPPVVKDGGYQAHQSHQSHKPHVAKNPQNFPGNRYKSLVMITQGAYQPVNVVTSDTTTLLQPDEGPTPPRGLAGYYHLALETATDLPVRNGTSTPRRPLTVKRPSPQPRVVEPEVDSGLSVGSASESDDVQSVKSASKVVGAAPSTSGVVLILEEGLADDDSWVEEVSHDEDEQGATTATEESSEDEANNPGDREEELRGYHRQAIDFTLHTIVEESCEESEAEPSSIAVGSPGKQRPPSASELEKYFFFGLGDGAAGIAAASAEADSLSETSSIYSEGLESLGQDEPEKNSADYLASSSSRLEKYFLSDFLGFDRDRRDSDGSVGSDSEGRPSPEQRRKRLVRARGTGRSHSSSLDNLLALTQSSANLSSQNSLQDLSLNPDSQETQSEGSSTETDGADDQTPAFGTDGQFDTVKRKKKKPRNLGTQSPRIPDDRNKSPEPTATEADADLLDAPDSDDDDDRAKTPQPDGTLHLASGSQTSKQQTPQASEATGRAESNRAGNAAGQGNEPNVARIKQHSRDSGFIGSCDDLLQHQRVSTSSDHGQIPNGNNHDGHAGQKDSRKAGGTPSQVTLAPPNASLSRKDSFNNWSSDEETNLMMSKMRQFFKTMVANSNSANSSAPSPAPSPRLPGNSPRSRIGSQHRTKPPQLVYFENELTRLMKTVPGIRDEQVKEIVEYLSSEDTWSDSYDSSDYTSSDLECAGGRRSALQEQISQSCRQIISKFDTTAAANEAKLTGKEHVIPSTQNDQPLNCRDTAFVYQKLVQSFTKMTGDGGSSDASSTPHSSPPLIAKVMHHIGSRLVALMHEVSEAGPAVQPSLWRRYPHHRTPSSASTTEDDDSTSDSANTPAQHLLPRSKSHDPLLLLNGHPAAGYQEGEEREASDNERFSWRGSFESALMPADSRTKLSLLACSGDVSASASALAMAAKRRSAGDLLFNPKSLSREQLDRVRSCGSIGGGSVSIEDKIWSNRRRSSVPDANTRGESGASAGDEDTEDELEYGGDSRATTLPRGLQSAATATNSLPRLPAVSPSSGGPVSMHKAHSVHHFLQQHNNVKSARYRPPGFARNNNLTGGTAVGPKRAVSAPGLQLPASSTSAGKRETARNRRQAVSLTPDDGSSLSEACSTPIIGGVRGGNLSNDEEMDRSLHTSLLGTRASSSSLGARSDSMASVYSGAGEGRWCGSVAVRGEVEFTLQYDYKQKTFEVRVTQCRDLAPVDPKRNRSDPYVKVYLLPDKSKGGKRKTKVKKHTLNPVFDETLKFHMSLNGLETRTLWLTVWHSDMFGRNDFLGEVRMALENKIFDDPTPRWYPLQERSEPFDDPITYKGEVIVGLKFVPPDPTQMQERAGDRGGSGDKTGSKTRKAWSKGALHVLVKEARNLQTRAKHGGTCDPFCKSYLLPDKGRSGKQKTGVVRRCTGGSPVWGHTFVYKDVSLQELADRGLELTVWDHDRLASNEFLGGVRFNLGTGKCYDKAVEWMDATGRELSLWQNMLERPNFWVEGAVTLRPNLHNHSRSNAT